MNNSDNWKLAGKEYSSRLLVGTGRYRNSSEAREAIEASRAEIVTVAVRRVNLAGEEEHIENVLDPSRHTYLPNSAGCYSAKEAIRMLRLGREASGHNLVKLEVIGDKKTLYPNEEETIEAAKALAKEGFEIMAYTTDNPIVAKQLEDIGCAAVMPLGAPIGSGLGIQSPGNIKTIAESLSVPVLVDAGIGTASDATIAMELGCDAVLVNTAIARARNPVIMAESMKNAVIAGRKAYLSGRMEKQIYATPSSPEDGIIAENK